MWWNDCLLAFAYHRVHTTGRVVVVVVVVVRRRSEQSRMTLSCLGRVRWDEYHAGRFTRERKHDPDGPELRSMARSEIPQADSSILSS